jgi:hypothetical protein
MSSNTESPAPVVESKKHSFFRKLRMGFFVFVCLVTAWALFHVEEYWRGKHAWNAYQRELVAKGEWFDLTQLAPPPVPDDQNFAMTPLLAPLLKDGTMPSAQVFENVRILLPNYQTEWMRGQASDFPKLAKSLEELKLLTFVNEDMTTEKAIRFIRNFTETNNAKLDEIREALKRPYSRFNLDYGKKNKLLMLFPHLATLKYSAQAFALEASEDLALEHPNEAYTNLLAVFELCDTLKTEPVLISQLVREAMFRIACQPLWEGLARHQWSAEQISAIEKKMENLDFLTDMVRMTKIDRNVLVDSVYSNLHQAPMETFATFEEMFSAKPVPSRNYLFGNLLFRIAIPSGWLYMEELNTFRYYDRCVISVIDTEHRQIDPKLAEERMNTALAEVTHMTTCVFRHRVGARMLLPSMQISATVAKNQTCLDLARIACGLEHYRLAHGQYPEKLDDLTPQFLKKLPNDIITGTPLKYRLDPKTQFYLYSVGWDTKDNQGAFTKPISPKPAPHGSLGSINETDGDWVWTYPPQP